MESANILLVLKPFIKVLDKSSEFYFSSPEDIILSKLLWYEKGNRVSERQWLDVLGVIKVQGNSGINILLLVFWQMTFYLY